MTVYRLSRAAEKDLEDLWIYLSQQSPIVADRQVGKLLNRLPMLAEFPNMGTARNNLLPGLRSFPSKPFIIFYILFPDRIEILRILHQSRDIKAEFSQQ
jgi:toxin ParE1/3/4